MITTHTHLEIANDNDKLKVVIIGNLLCSDKTPTARHHILLVIDCVLLINLKSDLKREKETRQSAIVYA